VRKTELENKRKVPGVQATALLSTEDFSPQIEIQRAADSGVKRQHWR
jgi:hypothetical protein